MNIAQQGFACRAINLKAYEALTFDILKRNSYPVVPDVKSEYSYQRHNIYKESEVRLAA